MFFVDFGNTDIVEKSNLRYMTSDLMKLPAQANKCMLNRMFLRDSDMWSEEDIEELKQLTEDKDCVVSNANHCSIKIKTLYNIHYTGMRMPVNSTKC